jgi:hypothetical protein
MNPMNPIPYDPKAPNAWAEFRKQKDFAPMMMMRSMLSVEIQNSTEFRKKKLGNWEMERKTTDILGCDCKHIVRIIRNSKA